MKTTREPIGPPPGGYAKQMPMGHYVDQEFDLEDSDLSLHNTDMTLCCCFPVYITGILMVIVLEIVEIVGIVMMRLKYGRASKESITFLWNLAFVPRILVVLYFMKWLIFNRKNDSDASRVKLTNAFSVLVAVHAITLLSLW